ATGGKPAILSAYDGHTRRIAVLVHDNAPETREPEALLDTRDVQRRRVRPTGVSVIRRQDRGLAARGLVQVALVRHSARDRVVLPTPAEHPRSARVRFDPRADAALHLVEALGSCQLDLRQPD